MLEKELKKETNKINKRIHKNEENEPYLEIWPMMAVRIWFSGIGSSEFSSESDITEK